MTAEVQEILTSGDVIVDGDVRSAHDFSHDDYSGPNDEQIQASEVLRAIDLWEAADDFSHLTRLGAKHADVRRQGGLKGCIEKSKERRNEARTVFLRAYGYPVEMPGEEDDATADEYYDGINAWGQFKKEITNPDARLMLKGVLEHKVESSH